MGHPGAPLTSFHLQWAWIVFVIPEVSEDLRVMVHWGQVFVQPYTHRVSMQIFIIC